MTLFIVVLPLRLTSPRQDFVGMMAAYMDGDPSVDVKSMDCQTDLQRMSDLRRRIAERVFEKAGYEEGVQVLDDMHEYYNCLLECETKGIVGHQETQPHGHNDNHQCPLVLEWESALSGELQADSTLEWERANLLWNLATLEAFQASKQSLDSKLGWSKAAQHFQNAASWLQHIPPSVAQVLDFSNTFLHFWQALLMAQSQRCIYESLACAKKPRHLLLAKLAAAAVPLFGELEIIIRKDEESTTTHWLSQTPSLTNTWADFGRAWGMYMSCKAEHHQALTSKEKKQWAQELARLDLAFRFASMCCEYCERAPLVSLQQLHATVDGTVRELRERMDQAEHDNVETHQQKVPHRNELTEIRGEKLVNIDQPLEKLLKPMQGEPIFQAVTDTQHLRVYVDQFHSEMDMLVLQMTGVAEERTESARKALATVNLPHSLTAYRQEQLGGGIPDDLWRRVQYIQRERRIEKLKQDLWELRDAAEVARSTYQKIKSQLEFDLESDGLFRHDNPAFEGHDADEVQKSLRHALQNYDRLLVTAQEGDSVLLRRLEILDTNPKYKLLQFQKSQLDRLLPGAGGKGGGEASIDTSQLSRRLVELSALFHQREVLLNTIAEEVKNHDIHATLEARAGTGTDQEFREALKFAQQSFDGIVYEIKASIDKQTGLVNAILAENEQFMMARERTNNSQSADSCIVMIEEAIEEIEQLSTHLKEGKGFYDVVIPKLDKLKQQVGDVSARLTVERLEYDDKTNRNRQEERDAEMAKRMAVPDGPNGAESPNDSNGPARPGQPGVAQVDHRGQPQVFVDDEKVATLVAMEFDPAKVVEALAKHDNDVDQALNELLSC